MSDETCECGHPEAAHGPWMDPVHQNYIGSRCRATIIGDGYNFPCDCKRPSR